MSGILEILDIKIIILSVSFIVILSYIIFKILDETKNIKKDKLIENSRYLEKKIEEMVEVEKWKLLKKYRNTIKGSVLAKYHINIYIFSLFAATLVLLVFEKVRRFFNQIPAAVLISIAVFLLPFLLLEIEVAMRRKAIRQHLPHFLLMFQQTLEVTENTLLSLKEIKVDIKEPIRGYIKEFLKNINIGMENSKAIEILKSRVDNAVFKSFCDNIFTDIEYGKIIKYELECDIKKAFAHEENYAQRITENSGNMVSILLVLVMFGISVNKMVNINDDFMDIIRYNIEGKIAINAVIVIIMIVFYFLKTSISYSDN